MFRKIFENVIAAFLLSLTLLTVALIIWYFMKESKTLLQDILFWVGAVPIGLFSIGLIGIGDYFGRGDFPYQASRSVSNQSPNQRALQHVSDIKSKLESGLNWIITGLLIWLFSYFL